MIVTDDFPVYKWLTCYEELLQFGFKEEEIAKVLEELEITKDQVSSVEDFEFSRDPGTHYYEREDCSTPCQVVRRGKFRGISTMSFGGASWTSYDKVANRLQLRVPGRYQGLKHTKILKKLFSNRWPWFESFTWAVYAMERSKGDYEMYLHTEGPKERATQSIYVPLRALIFSSKEVIIKRHTEYHEWYFKSEDRAHFRKAALDLLESPEAQRLFAILDGKE